MIACLDNGRSSIFGSARAEVTPPSCGEVDRFRAELVRRAKVILMLAGGGASYSEISARFGCAGRDIGLCRAMGRHVTVEGRPKLVFWELTRSEPTYGSTHWSSYRPAEDVGCAGRP
jgi:hypothetical protein